MQRILLILTALLLTAGTVSAQRMPERASVRRGNRLYNKGSYESSIERYRKAIEQAPGLYEATYDLGNALYKAEQFEQAEQVLAQAAADTLRTENERAEAFYNLGNAQFRQQKYREALASYRQSLRLNPSDMEAKYNYAYTKKLLDQNQDQNGGGDNDQNQDQNQDQQQNDQNQPQNGDNSDQQQDPQQGDPDKQEQQPPQEGQQQPVPAGISEQEQQQMLDAIQAQEDRTQEKLKEKQGVIVRGKKNW